MQITHKQIWTTIDLLAQRNNMTPSSLAIAAGLNPTSFNKSKRFQASGKPHWPSMSTISKILEITNTKFSAFAKMAEQNDKG